MEPGSALLAWFDRHRRELPWRTSQKPDGSGPDPYAVWISEIMLQQTRVETAIPYFERFLKRFPTLASLAAAEEAELLALWSGLGYYRRCRNLLTAAKEVASGAGALPPTTRELERLPGIGPYTAAAIASIAFGEVVPVLDGNVERVLSRFAAEPAGARTGKSRARLLALAASLLDRSRPGDSNQALMELGATVCTPRQPTCQACPLAGGCAARQAERAESFPAPAPRKPTLAVRQIVALVEERGRWLLFRRSDEAPQLAALWELPTVEAASPTEAQAALAVRFGGTWSLREGSFRISHAITDRRFRIEVYRAVRQGEAVPDPLGGTVRLAEASAAGGEPGWFSIAELSRLPLTGVARKIARRLVDQPS